MFHNETPLCQEHGCLEHSYNPVLEVGEDGLVKPPMLEDLFATYSVEEVLAYKEAWKLAAARQHQADLQALDNFKILHEQEKDIAEAVKTERERVIKLFFPYLKHIHRSLPLNTETYGGRTYQETYQDASDCEVCGIIKQLREEATDALTTLFAKYPKSESEALKLANECLLLAEHGDYTNGISEQGVDEGQMRSREMLESLKQRIDQLREAKP